MISPVTGCQLEAKAVSKCFGSKAVLHSVDLELSPGQFVAIVGRSGCGKSTLLRLLSGLDQANSGQVLINQKKLHGLNHDARIMFQDGRLLPWKTVLENIGLGVRGNWQQRAQQLLQQVGLQDRQNDWISGLSGGQRQRVALAKALITRPLLMLLDEPLGALDALTRIEMQQLIANLWQEEGFTAVLVTHDVEEAVTLADRIVVLEAGKISHDFRNSLQRPRRRDDPDFARLSGEILHMILQRKATIENTPFDVSRASNAVNSNNNLGKRATSDTLIARKAWFRHQP